MNQPLAYVHPEAKIAQNVVIEPFTTIAKNVVIEEGTWIGSNVTIMEGARIGKNCKISSHTFICEGVTIHDNVFIGHSVTFINDKYPRATTVEGDLQNEEDWAVVPTLIDEGASIGSSVTILCGLKIGAGAIIGAGSVVTKDVPSGEVWAGNPAKFKRKADL